MLTPNAVQQQIKTLILFLVEVGLSSDQRDPFVRANPDRTIEVTFPGAETSSVALKKKDYSYVYDELANARAFIAKLPDGALITMRYRYMERVLVQHSLGFFPSPYLEEFQNNPHIYLEDVIYADVVARNIVPFPIRFDYDCRPDVVKPVKHPKSHLTLGNYENCRIPVTSPLTPVNFTSFILRHFYNTAYMEFSDKIPVSADSFDESIHTDELAIMHVTVPRPT